MGCFPLFRIQKNENFDAPLLPLWFQVCSSSRDEIQTEYCKDTFSRVGSSPLFTRTRATKIHKSSAIGFHMKVYFCSPIKCGGLIPFLQMIISIMRYQNIISAQKIGGFFFTQIISPSKVGIANKFTFLVESSVCKGHNSNFSTISLQRKLYILFRMLFLIFFQYNYFIK